jgi:hypothetical protein
LSTNALYRLLDLNSSTQLSSTFQSSQYGMPLGLPSKYKSCPSPLDELDKGPIRANLPALGLLCGVDSDLKVNKHEIILKFYFDLNQILICPLFIFEKKYRFFSFDFRQNFYVRTFPQ